jgi:hypothetical protein
LKLLQQLSTIRLNREQRLTSQQHPQQRADCLVFGSSTSPTVAIWIKEGSIEITLTLPLGPSLEIETDPDPSAVTDVATVTGSPLFDLSTTTALTVLKTSSFSTSLMVILDWLLQQ